MAEEQAEKLLSDAQRLAASEGVLGPEEEWEAALEASRKAEQSLRLFRESGDASGAAAALCVVIKSLVARYEHKKALQVAMEERASFERSGTAHGQAMMHLAIAEVHFSLGEYKQALEAASQSLALFRRLGTTHMEIRVLHEILIPVRLKMNDTKQALLAANQALSVAKREEDNTMRAAAYYLLMQVLVDGASKEAMAAASEALALYKMLEDKKGQALVLQGIAKVHIAKKRYEDALKAAQDSLEMLQELEITSGMVGSLRLLVQAQLLLEQPEKALQVTEEQLQSFKRAGNVRGEAGCAPLLFDAHRAFDDHANECLEAAQDGINLFRALGDNAGEADLWLKCSQVHLAAKMHEETLHEAQEALMLFRDLKDRAGETAANVVLSEVYCLQGKPELAPNRPEALELLHELAGALAARDAEGWRQATGRLTRLSYTSSIIKEEDEAQILGPVVNKDPAGAEAFFRSLVPDDAELQLIDQGGLRKLGPVTFQSVPKLETYFGFRVGGIQYGPRFRCVDFANFRSSEPVDIYDPTETLGYAILQVQDCAEDWESVLRPSPFILDCALQSSSAMSRSGIPKRKIDMKEVAKPTRKGKQKDKGDAIEPS